MEGRIRQLEHLLQNAEIVAPPEHGVVGAGSVVTVVYEGDDESQAERYLVGHIEERQGDLDVISPDSPLGQALIGARAGEWVTYDAPNGELRVQLLKAETA
jgi:transcription elongation factor GreA